MLEPEDRWQPPSKVRGAIYVADEAHQALTEFLMEVPDGMGFSEFIMRSLAAWRQHPEWRQVSSDTERGESSGL